MRSTIIVSAMLLLFSLCSCTSLTKSISNQVIDNESSIGNAHILGDKNATIEIIEYSDFECPYSKQFFNEIMPRLKQEYILTNRTKLVFRHLPLNSVHPNAHKAAEAAECAARQGRFWEMHDALFLNGVGVGVVDFKRYASNMSLDIVNFDECLDTNSTRQKVIDDFYSGIDAGVKGTPTFIINGKIAPALKTYEDFKAYLDGLQK
jgi:protein-disulfide isomerase